ncbi:MAG: LamG-like jellyroll fold domain-containing protein [Roseibacillus sp.]
MMMARLEELASAYFSGTLKEGEIEELKELLHSDDKLLKRFCDEADFEQTLREVSVSVPLASMGPVAHRSKRSWMLAAAALLMLSFGLALFFHLSPSRQPILAEMTVSPHGLIAVSGPAEGSRKAGQLEKGATLRVVQGTVEIQFFEGVRCLIEAPAELSLEKKGLVHLKGGRARFDVEKQARGFQVISGDLELTDLGTSFGVDATNLTPEVHVLSGLVIGQGRSGNREETRVEGGQAMVLAEEGLMTPIPIDQERFPSSLGSGIPALLLSFDTENEEAGRCSGSIASRDSVQLVMDDPYSPQLVEGRFGKGLLFDGKKTHARANWPGISGSQARTVSFWFKTSKGGRANPILGWGLAAGNDRMSFFGLRLGKEGRLRMVSGRRWLEGVSVLDGGSWHHVVIVTGDYKKGAWPVTQLYIDGVPEEMTPRVPMDGKMASLDTFNTVTTDPGSEPLMIGRFMRAIEESPWELASFAGLIDEVIIAEGIVDSIGVCALYEGRLADSGLDLEN